MPQRPSHLTLSYRGFFLISTSPNENGKKRAQHNRYYKTLTLNTLFFKLSIKNSFLMIMVERLTKEWIEKVNKDFKEVADQAQRDRWKQVNSYPAMKRGQKKYAKTFKGKIARKSVLATRAKRIRHFILSTREKRWIQRFYIQCPPGYHVDHIVPLSKGGIHSLSNLQWLTKEENIKKGTRLDHKIEGRPQCLPFIDLKFPTKINRRKN